MNIMINSHIHSFKIMLEIRYQNLKTHIKSKLSSRKVRIFLVTLAVTIALISVIICSLVTFIDPNPYKEKVEELVLERTGYALSLDGPIRLNCFPRLMLEVADITLKKNKVSRNVIFTAETLKIYPSIPHLLIGKKVFKIELQGLNLSSYVIPSLKLKLKLKENKLEMRGIKIGLKKGKEQGALEIDKLYIDLREDSPKYYLKHQSDDFQLPLLLSCLGTKTKIKGTTKLDIEINAEGKTLHHIKKSLCGTLEMEIAKGKLHGIDLIASLKEAKSLLGTIASKVSRSLTSAFDTLVHRHHKESTGTTPFDSLIFKANLQNGVIHTEDLKISHQHFHVIGGGKINLPRNTVDCQVEALYKEHSNLKSKDIMVLEAKNSRAAASSNMAPLTIDIKGSLSDPNIKPDLNSYFKYIRQKE